MTEAANRIVATKGENVVSNMAINMEGLSPCTNEEAEKRLLYMLMMPPVRGVKMSL